MRVARDGPIGVPVGRGRGRWRQVGIAGVAVGGIALLTSCHGAAEHHSVSIAASCTHTVTIGGAIVEQTTAPGTVAVEVDLPSWTSANDNLPAAVTLQPGREFYADLNLASDGWVDPHEGDHELEFSGASAPVAQLRRATVTSPPNQKIAVRFVSATWWRVFNVEGLIGYSSEVCAPTGSDLVAEIPVVDIG